MDVSTVTGLVSGLQSATQLAKVALGMKIDGEVREAITELQNSLIVAQSAALQSLVERNELYERVRGLEQKIQESDDWKILRAEFNPVEFRTGRIAYSSPNPRYPGLYCPKCLENHRASRMQEMRASNGFHKAECMQCDTKLTLKSALVQEIPSTRTGWNG